MCDDPWRDGSGMGNAKSVVVPKWPDIVRRRSKIGTEAVAAAQIFIASMDSLGAGVQLGKAVLGPDIARSGQAAR